MMRASIMTYPLLAAAVLDVFLVAVLFARMRSGRTATAP